MVLCGQIREDQEAPPYVRRVLHRERLPHADPEDPQVGRYLRTSLFKWYTHKLMDAHRKENDEARRGRRLRRGPDGPDFESIGFVCASMSGHARRSHSKEWMMVVEAGQRAY